MGSMGNMAAAAKMMQKNKKRKSKFDDSDEEESSDDSEEDVKPPAKAPVKQPMPVAAAKDEDSEEDFKPPAKQQPASQPSKIFNMAETDDYMPPAKPVQPAAAAKKPLPNFDDSDDDDGYVASKKPVVA